MLPAGVSMSFGGVVWDSLSFAGFQRAQPGPEA